MVRNRLDTELVGNVSIRVVDIGRPDAWEVQGRGELALAVLVEQMRREGFELTVGKPQVVTRTIDGKLHEPFEAMTIDCPEEFVGAITQLMAGRKGRMEEMANHAAGWVRMDFIVPSRGLIGFRTDFLTLTRGTGIANAVFDGYRPWAGEIRARHTGSLVSDRSGTITPFALIQLADRGQFFVEPGQDTYEGMVVGINPRPEDLDINVTREKKLTNMRSSTADVIETLAKPLELDLEQAMEFCAPDECVEVTAGDRPGAQGRAGRHHPGAQPGAGQGPGLAPRRGLAGRAAGQALDTLMGVPRRARRLFVTVGVLVSLVGLALAACTVNPPPAPQSTDTPHNSPPPPQRPTQIIMGIDSIGAGFNPHLLSDLSPVNAAISALVLPSAFRPVPDPSTPTGSRWEMDPTLLVSAEVTNQNPFTVTYKIRPEAQWTDNAPIGADDFWYLWRQMVSQPGVVDPAGYDLITGVQSLEGGKQAVVTFAQPYPAWKELFSDLLPAHIVKDVPGGFAAGLARALPVTGGQFRVENIDPQRDEILIARNDRYWGPPAKPALILFRRAGAPAALADSVRNGDTQVAQVHGGSAAFAQLSAIPDVRTARIVTPRVMQLTLRANEPKLSDTQVRKAILGLLDVDLLAAVGAGSDNTVTLDQAQIRSPSDPGYEPTAPPAMTTRRRWRC